MRRTSLLISPILADEGQAQFAVAHELRFMRAAGARSNRRSPYKLSELLSFAADGNVQHSRIYKTIRLTEKIAHVRNAE